MKLNQLKAKASLQSFTLKRMSEHDLVEFRFIESQGKTGSYKETAPSPH